MIKAHLIALFKHPIRTTRENAPHAEEAWDMVDAEFREAVAELVSKLASKVRRLAGGHV
ncbi:hypothetical protein [Nonomuraea rubra]|uniref:hypothetical protein n=1 Tax=Nonomuraea rubra TaxID=46180 RepID=UPI0033C8CAE8